MTASRLILAIPEGTLTATSLTAEGYAAHRSPGSGRYFQARAVLVELALQDGKPAFQFLDEGGWRDAAGDTAAAMAAAAQGKKTKTALSNNAFSITPISAYSTVYLAKTGGELLPLEAGDVAATFEGGECHEGMSPDEIAAAIGATPPARRTPRIYMTLAPVEMLVMSNLTPAEYVWYATRRPGKIFRQVMFAEIFTEPKHLVAESVLEKARAELEATATKKTKTLLHGDVLNRIPFSAWIGYDDAAQNGLYAGDRDGMRSWTFPAVVPRAWERAY